MIKVFIYLVGAMMIAAMFFCAYWVLGSVASWVLAYFKVAVPWYICAVALLLLSVVFGRKVVRS